MPEPTTPATAVTPTWRARLRAAGSAVATAWGDASVRRGFLGTVMISLGALSPAYLPRTTPLWRWLDSVGMTGTGSRVAGTLVTMAGLLLLVDAWFRLRPRRSATGEETFVYHHLRHWAILLIWGAPMLLAPPIFSHDAYSYAAQGWLLHNDINPYQAPPSVLPGPFADQVSWVWRNTVAPYGPLSLQIQRLLVELSGFNPYLAAVLQRIPALLGVVSIGLLVPRIAARLGKDAAFAAWFATLNPLLVIDFIGGAHNDSQMIGLVIFAIWVAGLPKRDGARSNDWWLLGAVIVGVAATIKQPALLAAYVMPLIQRPWRDFSAREITINAARIMASCLTALGSFALVSWATGLGFGWRNAVGVPGLVVTPAPFMIIGYLIQLLLDWQAIDPTQHAAIRYSRLVGMIVAGLSVSWLAITEGRRRPHSFLAKAYLVVAICAPALRSWYLLWGGLMIPWTDFKAKAIRVSVWLSLTLLCYDGVVMAWRNDALAFGVALVGGIWWIARSAQRKQDQSA